MNERLGNFILYLWCAVLAVFTVAIVTVVGQVEMGIRPSQWAITVACLFGVFNVLMMPVFIWLDMRAQRTRSRFITQRDLQ